MPKGEYLQYGGQAVVEGVMMRSPRFFAVACRAPDGRIVVQAEPLEKTWIGRQKWLKWPFFRGSLALIDTIALGIRSMKYASNVHVDPRFQTEADAVPMTEKAKRIQDVAIGSTFVVSLGLGVFLFNYLPNLIAQPLQYSGASGTLINLASETIKVVIFIAYLWAIGKLPDIQEVFKYHGAEHKAINAMEAGDELGMEATMRQTRLHPRCGTSFAIVVLIVSFIIFTFVPRYPLGQQSGVVFNATVRFLVELAVLPLISGIAYEVIRFAGRMKSSSLVQGLLWPGLMSQYLTTREPEEKHAEVALAALQAVVDAEEGLVELTDSRETIIGEPMSNQLATDEPVAQSHP